MYKRLLLVFMAAFLSGIPTLAQEVPPVDVTRIREVTTLFDYLRRFSPTTRPVDIFNNWDNSEVRTVEGAALSSDGEQIAWYGEIRERTSSLSTRAVCVHTFALLETFCYLLPRDWNGTSPLIWSTDGRYVFYTEDRTSGNVNSDIWALSVGQGLAINVTNNGRFSQNEASPTAAPEFMPAWDAFNNRLYYLRDLAPTGVAPAWELRYVTADALDAAFDAYAIQLDAQAQTRIAELEELIASRAEQTTAQRQAELDAFEGDPAQEVVPEITTPGRLIPISDVLFNFTLEDVGETFMPAIEPVIVGVVDGLPVGSQAVDTFREMFFAPTQIDIGGLFMAMVVNNRDDMMQSGVWLVNLADASLFPAFTVANLITLEPDWIERVTLTNIQWTANSDAVVIAARLEGRSAEYGALYHFGLGTFSLRPVLNFGTLDTENDFFGGDVASFTPDSAVLLPDDQVLYMNRSALGRVNVANVPPSVRGDPPTTINLPASLAQQRRLPSSVGVNDQIIRVILDNNLITIGR